MIPYGKQNIDSSDIKAVVKTLKSDYLTTGPKVKEFEKKISSYCDTAYGVACSNGTSALHLAYLAAGLKKGDEVITTPNTFVATTNMLLVLGVKPVFCDIRPDTYNIDENKIKPLITKKTKAIVVVDFAGQPVELQKISSIAKKYKLILIEDSSHALGAKYKNKKVGSLADLTIFSFHPVKSIATGEGGMVLTKNKNFYNKMLHLRSHGVSKDKNGFNVMTDLGYNYRLSDIQAALGVSQLKKLGLFIKKRRQVVKWYNQQLKGLGQIVLPVEMTGNKSSWHLFVIRTKSAADQLGLYKYLLKNGVGVNFHYPAVYSHPFYRKHGYGSTKLTNMENYHHTSMTLPCYPGLTFLQVRKISNLIKKYFTNHE